jgi:cytidylate kinase
MAFSACLVDVALCWVVCRLRAVLKRIPRFPARRPFTIASLVYLCPSLNLRLITIDGPVAVGKSSVGLLLAERLGFQFFDTGVIYRTFTYKALTAGISPADADSLITLANKSAFTFRETTGSRLVVLVDGEDVSGFLTSQEIERNVALIAKIPQVRARMVEEQRRMAEDHRLVMAGRDIGTVVLPWADLKVFLVASIEERARRRFAEMQERGANIPYETVLSELRQRDHNDMTRKISPLKPADDAVTLDTDGLTLEQVVDRIVDLAYARERA